MTGSHIGIYVSMGRNFPQGDMEKSVWDEIPWAGTHKGHGGLQRKPYWTIQDEILVAKSHNGNHVRRGELLILVLTRHDGVPI